MDRLPDAVDETLVSGQDESSLEGEEHLDAYFSADVETDGPIPGTFSILSFGLVYAGSSNGSRLTRPKDYSQSFYRELRPISKSYQQEALDVNGLDRASLLENGCDPIVALRDAAAWIERTAGGKTPVLIAYPLSFDWSFLYWYFMQFCDGKSPFGHSRCFDLKTAYAVKAGVAISEAGRSRLPRSLRADVKHTHNALDDAVEQAMIFANVFEWRNDVGFGD